MGTITGTNGNDTIIGTDGGDIINSGNGDDIVNGGAGSDQINGGAGNDTLIYTVSENLGGFRDIYTGGSGIDTVRIQLSFEQWNDPAVRWELERYVKFLSTVKMNPQGEVSNGSASDFVFNFGTSTLTVQMMEKLAVWVRPESGGDYAQVDYLTSLITGDTAGRVVEAGGVGNSEPGTQTVIGQLKSDDLNGADNLFQSAGVGNAAKYGTYTVSSNGEWKYTLNNGDSRVQQLAANDILSDSFTVSSADGAVKMITITIVGSNDAPVVTGALSSTVAEGSTSYSINLLDGASDVDHGQTATLSVTGVSYKVDGTAVFGMPDGVSLAGGKLSVDPTHIAFDHLAVGEHTTIVVSYNIQDAQGATVAQQASITINGTNDVPVVSAALGWGEEEGEGSYELNLLAGASDVDHNETASLSVANVTYRVDGGDPSVSAPPGVLRDGNKLSVDTSKGAFNHLAVGAHTTIVVSYNVKDVHGATVAQVATITIDGTNDTPVVSTALVSTAAEGDAAYTMNLLAGASDADDGETASLSIANIGYRVDGGAVSSTAPDGISLAGNTLSVNPVHSTFDRLAVGEHATIVVTYSVKDAQGAMVAQSATITITGTNDAPTVSAALTSEKAEGAGPYDVNLLAGASDVDHGETGTLSVANVSYTVDGALFGGVPDGVSLSGSTLTVDPANSTFDHLAVGEHSTIVVSYNVKDAQGATVAQSATITVTGTNDAPTVSAALTSEKAEGAGSYDLNLLAGASDVDHGENATLSVANVSYTVDGAPFGGVPAGVSLSGSTLTVDPANTTFDHLAVGEHSTIVVYYNVKDAQGATVAQSAMITITGTNDAPTVSAALTSEKAEGAGSYDVNLLAGASDVDHGETGTLSVANVSYTVDGAAFDGVPAGVSLSGTTLTVDPANSTFDHLAVGEHSTIVVSYNVKDAQGATVAQSATITITGTNDAPTVSAALTSEKAEGADSYDVNLLAGASDVDHGETGTLSVANVSYTVDGAAFDGMPAGVSLSGSTLTVDPANSTFDHLAVGEHSTIVVSYNVKDAQGATVAQSATITITGTNDAPTVSAALTSEKVEGAGSYDLNLLAGASDVDHGETATLSVANVSYTVDGAPFGGVPAGVSLSGSTLTVDPANSTFDHLAVGEHSTIVVSYNVKDAQGATVAQTATITITGTNDAPVVSAALTSEKAEGAASYDVNLLAGASDVDHGETGTLSVANVSYTVDGASFDGMPAGVSLSGSTLTVDPANSTFDHLAVGEHSTIVVSYNVKDAQGATVAQSATITVTGTNDAPTVSAALTSEKAEGAGSYDVNLLAGASDVDHGETGTLSVANVSYTVDGTAFEGVPAGVSLSGSTLTVDPANSTFDHLAVGDHSTIVVYYNVKDAQGATVAQSATITISGTNDAPTVSAALTSEKAEGAGSYGVNLLAGASDVDHGETATLSVANVSYTVDGSPFGGVPAGFSLSGSTLTVDPANSAFDHLAVGEHSTILVNYNVKDAQGATVAQSATITITGTNDAPLVTGPITATMTEDGGPVTLDALANASDVDHGTILTAVSVPASLPAGVSYNAATQSFTIDPGNATYQSLAVGETKEVVVNYGVSDGIATVGESLKFTVAGINDAPVLISSATPVLANVLQNAGGPSGAAGTLVSSLVNLNPPVGGIDNVTDVDNGAVTGIALTGTNAANGTWWYSTNGGASWTAVGSVSNSSALLLSADANTLVYFQGNTSYSGTVSDSVTFRAWDGTSGAAGTKADTSVNGGSSAFSSATDIAAITVVANNQPPVGVADRIIVSNNTFVTLSTSALLGNDTDIDGYALAITGVSGGTGISGLTLNANAGTISFTSNNSATSGSFQYTVSDGAGGSATASVTIDIRTATNNNSTGDTIDLSTAGTYQASYIDAGGGPDIVTGGAAGDVFIGGTGNAADTLNGSAGNDLLSGNGGDDQLSGGAGNDVLTGGLGDDKMDGGAGSEDMLDFSDGTVALNFTLVQSGAFTNTSGAGGLGADMYMNMEGVVGTGLADTINGSAGNDIIRGGAGNDILDGKGGSDLLDFSDGTAGITFTLVNNGAGTFAGSAAGLGTDTYTGFEGVIGTAFADNLTGSASADQLRGGGGNDVISGLAGDDRIVGGAGADTLTGGGGRDTFVFDTAPNAVDSVTDFNASGSAASGDWIELSLATFTGITTAAGNQLSSSEFAASAGGGATDVVAAGVRVIYDSTTGNLYYDSDGQGAANRTLFATLTLENPADTFNQNDIKIGS